MFTSQGEEGTFPLSALPFCVPEVSQADMGTFSEPEQSQTCRGVKWCEDAVHAGECCSMLPCPLCRPMRLSTVLQSRRSRAAYGRTMLGGRRGEPGAALRTSSTRSGASHLTRLTSSRPCRPLNWSRRRLRPLCCGQGAVATTGNVAGYASSPSSCLFARDVPWHDVGQTAPVLFPSLAVRTPIPALPEPESAPAAPEAAAAKLPPTTQVATVSSPPAACVSGSSVPQSAGKSMLQGQTGQDHASNSVLESPSDIRIGTEAFAEASNFRVAARAGQELEILRLPKLPWSSKLPRALLGQGRADQTDCAEEEPPIRPDGSVRLRIFDGTSETHTLPLELPCTILGSSIKCAHVADGTHTSVKTEHAALIFVPPESFLLQSINGEVSLSCASQHAAVSCTLLRERRSAPQCRAPPKFLSVGSMPEDITRQHCCFQLAKSEVVFFVDLLPSAASVRALGTARHLLQAFVDGKTSDAKTRRAKEHLEHKEKERGPRAAKLVPASQAEADSKPRPPPASHAPLPPLFGKSETALRRSPSVWRHDRVQRSISALLSMWLCLAARANLAVCVGCSA